MAPKLDGFFPSYDTAPRIQLRDLTDCWIELACCQGTKAISVESLAEKRPTALLCNVLPKFKCSACQQGPQKIYLSEMPRAHEDQAKRFQFIDMSLFSSSIMSCDVQRPTPPVLPALAPSSKRPAHRHLSEQLAWAFD